MNKYMDMTRQATEQGAMLITVRFRDKATFEYLYYKEISRALLAKMYHEQRVTHAINGVPVIDI